MTTPARIVAVVEGEGEGEVAAVPVLLQRMVSTMVPGTYVDVARPYRFSRGALLAEGGLERAVRAAAEQGGPNSALLVLLDADDDCPAKLGPSLLARAAAARSDRPRSIVLATREFEAWFLASVASLGGCRGLAERLTSPADSERKRDCKGWLSARRVDGRSYKPTADQAALAAKMDLQLARANSPSFDKLWRDVERLVAVITRR